MGCRQFDGTGGNDDDGMVTISACCIPERRWRRCRFLRFVRHPSPQRRLPSREMIAEYMVELVEDGQATEVGIATHVATDQLCFLDGEFNRVPLLHVPPIVFSELMRDVDLFVAVASVANDPSRSRTQGFQGSDP